MRQLSLILFLSCCINLLWAQQDSVLKSTKKQRLDFAKTMFELGGSYIPSFTGKRLTNGTIKEFQQPAAVNPYLTWGAFHFWGHAEFYVTFPLGQFNINKNDENGYQLKHSVATGARVYPWAMKEKRIRPYIGVNWGALDFKQKLKPDENQTELSKDIMLNYEGGLVYNYNRLALRFGINYFSDNKWNYPISKTQKAELKTPPIFFQVGLVYAYEASKKNTKENIDRWNNYPRVSALSHKARRFGDIFVGVGPSMSFSLVNSEYNKAKLPYLKEKLTSNNYFDIALGYHFNKANIFTALSFRNPKFTTEGYGSKQVIQKTSLTFEVNKFLTDYSGFAPFIGLSVAYDNLKFNQEEDGNKRELTFDKKIEPGVTIGWDIVPGKTDEALVLRTNLRWYPLSEFKVEGMAFNFSQLEYNLIQVVFYLSRLKKKIS